MKKFLLFALCFLPLVVKAETLPPKDDRQTNPAESEFYLGILFPRNSISGDFDGERYYANTTAIAIVPKLKDAWGVGVNAGLKSRIRPKLALGLEGSYVRSKHDATWLGLDGKAEYNALSLDFKMYFLADQNTQPFLQAGFYIPTIKVLEGYGTINGDVRDVTYRGSGFGVGGGLLHYFTPRVSFQLATIFRRAKYDEIDYGASSKINPKLTTQELGINLGLNIHFKIR